MWSVSFCCEFFSMSEGTHCSKLPFILFCCNVAFNFWTWTKMLKVQSIMFPQTMIHNSHPNPFQIRLHVNRFGNERFAWVIYKFHIHFRSSNNETQAILFCCAIIVLCKSFHSFQEYFAIDFMNCLDPTHPILAHYSGKHNTSA